jgi:hypothetical protein
LLDTIGKYLIVELQMAKLKMENQRIGGKIEGKRVKLKYF